MPASWPALVFGWPSALGGALLLVLGVALGRAWLATFGAVLAAGFCAYLAMNPLPFRLIGLLALACNVACVFAVRRQAPWTARALLLPFLVVLAYLAHAMRG